MRALPLCLLLMLSLFASQAAAQLVGGRTLPAFGEPDGGAPPIRGFGKQGNLPEVIEKDRSSARSAIAKVDTNKDGSMSRDELRNSKYKKYEKARFAFDFSRNDKLTAKELANYYAKLRVDKAEKAKKQGPGQGTRIQWATRSEPDDQPTASVDSFVFSQLQASGGLVHSNTRIHTPDANLSTLLLQDLQGLNGKLRGPIVVLNGDLGHQFLLGFEGIAAQQLVARYDKNSSGRLERDEWQRIDGSFERADANGDEIVDIQEINRWFMSQKTEQPSESSDWFVKKDTNRDRQIDMAEYASEWTAELLKEFRQYDRNGDGLITAAERAVPLKAQGRRFESKSSVVIQPGVDATGSIEIDEDFVIADIDLQLSISHSAPLQLDAILVSPAGRRIKLFRGEGKSWQGQVFRKTLFDNEATSPIGAATAPATASWVRSEGADSPEKSGLGSFYGHRSRGVWRLIISGERNYQTGLLDNWALVLEPQRS